MMQEENKGSLEIATGDDASEPIYIRQYTGNFITLSRELTLLDENGNTKIPGDLTVSGNFSAPNIYTKSEVDNLIAQGSKIEQINNDLTISGNVTVANKLTTYILDSPTAALEVVPKICCPSIWCTNDAEFNADVDVYGELTVHDYAVILGDLSVNTINGTRVGNMTITHKTDEIEHIDKDFIGTFCETNGGIYTGYNEISETDCICQVQQSNTLNPRIVGIITATNQFASHGDVLVKIVPGTYHLGDILCPDITGKARKATETELQYMMLYAIPRPKITSLDTKIEGTVACFIV